MQRKHLVGLGVVLFLLALAGAWRSCGASREGASSQDRTAAAKAQGGQPGARRARDGKPPAPASLAGRVTRASDGAGIPGAVVAIAPAELMSMLIGGNEGSVFAVTDASGAWKAPRVRPGAYLVSAAAEGFLPGTFAKLTLAGGEQRTGIDLALTAGGTVVRGTVTDVGGGAIADARISALLTDDPGLGFGGRAEVATFSRADGSYALTLPDGGYALGARHDDYAGTLRTIEVAGKPLTIDFALVPGAVVRGQVIARDTGAPVPGALVHASNERRGAGGRSLLAEADGSFVFRGLSSGTIAITAMGDGYASTGPTEVDLGIAEQVEGVRVLVDRAFSIAGRVVRKDTRDGLAGVMLGAVSLATKRYGLALEPSDRDGAFTIVGLQPASYILFVLGEGSVPELGKPVELVDRDVTDLVIELAAGATITGRVEPAVADARVSLELAGSVGLANMFDAAKSALVHGKTDASGAFVLRNVPSGTFSMVAAAPDGQTGKLPLTVTGADQANLVVRLEPRGAVSGRVIDTHGAPVAGAEVRAVPVVARATPFSISMGRRQDTVVTAPDGSYRIVGIEPGKVHLHASHGREDGWVPDDDEAKPIAIELGAGKEKTGVTLTIPARDGVIRGQVLGPDGKPAPDAWVMARLVIEGDAGADPFAARQPVLTGGDGRFAIDRLRPGSYDLVVEGPRGATRGEKRGVKTGDSVTITLASLGTLTGKVTLGGTPATSFQLSCKGRDGEVDRQFSAVDGRYTLDRLAPGAYECTAESRAGRASGKVDVPAGPATLDLALTRWASVTGTVVSALTGKPVAGVLALAAGDAFSPQALTEVLGGSAPTTDASGRFLVERVPAGKGQVAIMPRQGMQDLGKRDFTAVEGQRVDIGTIEIVPPRTGEAGTFGLATSVEGDKLTVSSVADGGPAAKAGVQVGDRIVSLDGRDVAALAPAIASRLLESGSVDIGQTVQLGLERGGAPVRVTLVSVTW